LPNTEAALTGPDAADGAAAAAAAGAPLGGAPPVAGAAGAAGLELVHPAIDTAIITSMIAITLIDENFIDTPLLLEKFPVTTPLI
jgi:hypothetical protein